MIWEKKGLLIAPGSYPWMVTHAQNPFPEIIENNIIRVHFAGRDKYNRAHGGYAIVKISNHLELLHINSTPSLSPGKLGCFDDCGVMPSCIIKINNLKYLYYTGWTQRKLTPFSFFIGLAISNDDGKTYNRYSQAPVLDRNFYDPYMVASPWIIVEDDIFRMWYVSCSGWDGDLVSDNKGSLISTNIKHYYRIKYSSSKDGISWNTNDNTCIDFNDDEYAIARPMVWKDEMGKYHMFFSFRGGNMTYRLGYAVSNDGIIWNRKDNKLNLEKSKTGWDSQMICYGCILIHKEKTFLLYNGNNYGSTGCGYAEISNKFN
ncbi:MAG: hypothetical protein JXA44_04150 [Methanospirillaceae archaeon]|nr:hypothetical protein [Methanospirillaceae archaeon]